MAPDCDLAPVRVDLEGLIEPSAGPDQRGD